MSKSGQGRGDRELRHVETRGRGDVGTWGCVDVGMRERRDVGTRARRDSGTRRHIFEEENFRNGRTSPRKLNCLCYFAKMINWMLFKYQLNTQRNLKIGFSKSHSRHPSQSSTLKQSRRPNGPLLTLQLKFHVAAFVVVVAQNLDPYDFVSVTKV